jgi:hypothetical protein
VRKPTLDYFGGLQASAPMANRRQHPWTGWRLAVEFLEQSHMERVVELGARWELQLVGDRADPFPHLERPVVLRAQIAMTGDVERGDWMVQQPEPNPITGVELELPMIVVVLKLVVVLCLLEPLAHLEDELVALYQLMMHHR